MKVSVIVMGGVVRIMARAEGHNVIGDLVREVRRGESFLGLSYQAWAALGDGEHDVDAQSQPQSV